MESCFVKDIPTVLQLTAGTALQSCPHLPAEFRMVTEWFSGNLTVTARVDPIYIQVTG